MFEWSLETWYYIFMTLAVAMNLAVAANGLWLRRNLVRTSKELYKKIAELDAARGRLDTARAQLDTEIEHVKTLSTQMEEEMQKGFPNFQRVMAELLRVATQSRDNNGPTLH